MSRAEDIFERSLRLVLEDNAQVIRNHRPNWLRNPATGRNLELDFFLPSGCIGFEIQGPRHYDNVGQIVRDDLKARLASAYGCDLICVGVFKNSPQAVHRLLRNASFHRGQFVGLRSFDRAWLTHDAAKDAAAYRRAMQTTYGASYCHKAPHEVALAAAVQEFVFPIGFDVRFMHKGKQLKGQIVSYNGKSVEVRVFGTQQRFFVKRSKVIT